MMNRREFLRRVPVWTAPVVSVVTLPAHAMLSPTTGPCIFDRVREGPARGEIERIYRTGVLGSKDECRRVCEHVEIGVFDADNCVTANPTRDSES